jgi:hypothetical protein
MKESDLVKEVSRRAALPEETAEAVLHSVRELMQEGEIDGATLLAAGEATPLPPDDPSLVDRLIAKAKKHPLGLEFLASGLLATVAITLGAHAFTVEAARRRLEREKKAEKELTPA